MGFESRQSATKHTIVFACFLNIVQRSGSAAPRNFTCVTFAVFFFIIFKWFNYYPASFKFIPIIRKKNRADYTQ